MAYFMDPVSPLFALCCIAVAVLSAFFISKYFKIAGNHGRYLTIDGLRGYLAFFVFLHHACVWYFYLKTGRWETPPSNLYTQFGQSAVALFFMITGFLFFSKLIDGRKKPIDWLKLFVSRILRLTPLYVFVMLLLFTVIALLSEGVLREDGGVLLRNALHWLTFTVVGQPDLNGVLQTKIILAGVTWSLPYEWFFYLSLPVLAILVQVRPPWPFLLLGVVSLVGLYFWYQGYARMLPFLGGISAAFLVRLQLFRDVAVKKAASVLIVACLAVVVEHFPTAYSLYPVILLSVVFALIAGGNTLFGILVSVTSRTLGEMAYSIYLLHGLTLFVFFKFLYGQTAASALGVGEYWLLVAGVTPLLVLMSLMTFRCIEKPFLQLTPQVTQWLMRKLRRSNG
jgi:peptidoglycan/LPS O-acetylase OafA/YrhL